VVVAFTGSVGQKFTHCLWLITKEELKIDSSARAVGRSKFTTALNMLSRGEMILTAFLFPKKPFCERGCNYGEQ
jgi:hypothetical protein